MWVPMSRSEQLAEKAAHSWAVGVAECVGAVEGAVDAEHRPSVAVDEFGRVELGVDHDGVDAGVAEQRLDDVDGCVVVEVFGGEHSPAVVGAEREWCAVGSGRASQIGESCEPVLERSEPERIGAAGALE